MSSKHDSQSYDCGFESHLFQIRHDNLASLIVNSNSMLGNICARCCLVTEKSLALIISPHQNKREQIIPVIRDLL